MKLSALLAAAALGVAAGDATIESRIIGGENADKGRYPAFTSLLVDLCSIFPPFYEYFDFPPFYEYFDFPEYFTFPPFYEYSGVGKGLPEGFTEEHVKMAYQSPAWKRLVAHLQEVGPQLKSQQCPLLFRLCGGTLIAKNAILTAAHCFIPFFGTPQPEFVRVGDFNDGSLTDGKEIRVKKHIIHPDRENIVHNDFMILILEENVDNALPIFLLDEVLDTSSKSTDDITQVATAIGFGLADLQGSPYEYLNTPSTLQEVDINLIDDETCKKSYDDFFDLIFEYVPYEFQDNVEYQRESFQYLKDIMICAGGVQEGVCNGDSGGPLFFSGGKNFDLQFGVTSWGAFCGRKGFPGVFARVSSAKDFILENVPNAIFVPRDPDSIPDDDDDDEKTILLIIGIVIAVVAAVVIGAVVAFCCIKKRNAAKKVEFDDEAKKNAALEDLEKKQAAELKVVPAGAIYA